MNIVVQSLQLLQCFPQLFGKLLRNLKTNPLRVPIKQNFLSFKYQNYTYQTSEQSSLGQNCVHGYQK